jgi:hypothetical protein
MSNWWANKVSQQAPVTQQQSQPAPRPYQPPTQPQNYPPVQQQVPMGDRCPGCGSGNYGGATPEARKRCYDCGYPIQQSGTGVGKGVVGGQPNGGLATPARQVATGGYNPQTIIGHI